MSVPVAARAALCATGFVATWAAIAWVTWRWDPWRGAVPAWLRWPGAVLGVLGGVLALACVVTFVRRGRGTPAPFDPPTEFVAAGPYGWVRNPMYVGGALLLLGAGLALGSPVVCGLGAVFLVLAHLFVVLYEEPRLARRFGPQYERYKATVPRWVPGRARV